MNILYNDCGNIITKSIIINSKILISYLDSIK